MYLFLCECGTAIIAWLLLVVETRFKAKTSLKMKMEMKIYIYFVSFHFICHIYIVWLYECGRTAYSRNLFRTQYPFFVLLSRFKILNVACIHGFSMKHVIVNVRMCEKKSMLCQQIFKLRANILILHILCMLCYIVHYIHIESICIAKTVW